MARKADPNDVVDDFQRFLGAARLNFASIVGELAGKSKLQKEASIDAFLRAAVGFETFRSDWHIAAITAASSPGSPRCASRGTPRITRRDCGKHNDRLGSARCFEPCRRRSTGHSD